jgi:hypothetical protein
MVAGGLPERQFISSEWSNLEAERSFLRCEWGSNGEKKMAVEETSTCALFKTEGMRDSEKPRKTGKSEPWCARAKTAKGSPVHTEGAAIRQAPFQFCGGKYID